MMFNNYRSILSVFAIAGVFSATAALADEQTLDQFAGRPGEGYELNLMTVTSDLTPGSTLIKIWLDPSGTMRTLRYIPSQGMAREFTLGQMDYGVVLSDYNGLPTLKLKAENFSLLSGGTIKLQYLFDWRTGEYRTFELGLFRSGNSWAFQTPRSEGGRMVYNMYVAGRTNGWGQLMGINWIRAW